MVRVHFGPPLLEKEKEGLRPGRESTTRTQAKMDSKAGSWQQSGGLLQPAWLSRRKASPGPPLLKSWKLKIESWKLWTVNFQLLTFNWKFGGLAQLGERLPCKQEVTGSIPVLSTKEIDWNSKVIWCFIESLERFKDAPWKLNIISLWCNYEKATVKENF